MKVLDKLFRRKDADEWCSEGNSLCKIGKYHEGLICFNKALDLDPEHALSWFNAGFALKDTGESNLAIEAFEAFLRHAPPEAQSTLVPIAVGYIEKLKAREGTEVIEEFLRRHLSRLKNQFARVRGFAVMEPRWNKLLRHDILTVTVDVIEQEMEKSLQHHKHYYQSRKFGDIQVVVSTVPAVNPVQTMAYFAGGYIAFLDTLLNEPSFDPDSSDLAHWVFCDDGKQKGVHLTFLPAKYVDNFIVVVAQDLMTAAEKSKMGIA